jgi:hypothetical protein
MCTTTTTTRNLHLLPCKELVLPCRVWARRLFEHAYGWFQWDFSSISFLFCCLLLVSLLPLLLTMTVKREILLELTVKKSVCSALCAMHSRAFQNVFPNVTLFTASFSTSFPMLWFLQINRLFKHFFKHVKQVWKKSFKQISTMVLWSDNKWLTVAYTVFSNV